MMIFWFSVTIILLNKCEQLNIIDVIGFIYSFPAEVSFWNSFLS